MPKSKAINSTRMGDKEYLIANQVHDDSKSDVKNTATTTTANSILSTKSNASSGSRAKMNRPVPSTGTANVKPNTILSLEDRDIVIIDTADYKESTSTEDTVIVVEKPRPHHHQQQQPSQQVIKTHEIDLAQLLETNWPAAAGDLAVALSTRSTSSGESNSSSNYQLSSASAATPTSAVITERNRSKNPLSHLGQPKIRRNVLINAKMNSLLNSMNLINLDSDGSSSATESKLFRVRKRSHEWTEWVALSMRATLDINKIDRSAPVLIIVSRFSSRREMGSTTQRRTENFHSFHTFGRSVRIRDFHFALLRFRLLFTTEFGALCFVNKK